MATRRKVKEARIQGDLCCRYFDRLTEKIDAAALDFALIPDAIILARDLTAELDTYRQSHILILSNTEDEEEMKKTTASYDAMVDHIHGLRLRLTQPPFMAEEADQTTLEPEKFVPPATPPSFSNVKLPELQLPTFSGEISQWTAFHDMFKATVHQQASIPAVQKFQYLKMALQGVPSSLIKNLPLTEANYTVALNTLTAKYAQRRLIATHHLAALLKCTPPSSLTYEDTSEFVSFVRENVAALRAANEPVDSWGKVIALSISLKLPEKLRTKYEQTLTPNDLPDLEDLLIFFDKYVTSQQWKSISPPSSPQLQRRKAQPGRDCQRKATSMLTQTSSVTCICCAGQHPLYQCQQFQTMEAEPKLAFIRRRQMCENCLSIGHTVTKCRSRFSCRRCQSRHHSSLHAAFTGSSPGPTRPPSPQPSTSRDSATQHLVNLTRASHSAPPALLGTAVVQVKTAGGKWIRARAVLDGGSTVSYVTSACAGRLGQPIKPTTVQVKAFADESVDTVRGEIPLTISSLNASITYNLPAIVVPVIIPKLPLVPLPRNIPDTFVDLPLADPKFHIPAGIDMLIGADLYPYILTGGREERPPGPIALQTTLGWVITGNIPPASPSSDTTLFVASEDRLSKQIARFWELEEVVARQTQSPDERKAEQIFSHNVVRRPDGRYAVPLLLRNNPPQLGLSYSSAWHCFGSLQRRLAKNPVLRHEYNLFMAEYESLGHMHKVDSNPVNRREGYFLPHHPVIKETTNGIKLRVVFNGSRATSNGVSLNDELLPGASLQTEIATILMRFRRHKFVFSADIRQMYRQIEVLPEFRKFQKILWTPDPSKEPDIFELRTVTYGLTDAPFLALRTLKQLATDEARSYPRAVQILLEDTYVDDVVSGADTLRDALDLRQDLQNLLLSAKLELRKWTSNCPRVLEGIPNEHRAESVTSLSSFDGPVKILGLYWSSTLDQFTYEIVVPKTSPTKRNILSDISRIFDPLGWLSPVVLFAKALMQRIWMHATDWDEFPPDYVISKWREFKDQLPHLSSIRIPRHFDCSSESELVLAGFCDASDQGFAAVVYLVALDDRGNSISLVAAKSKVAPLKRISIPRLELCSALLLARLMSYVRQKIALPISAVYTYSDSSVALNWITSSPHRWKTFVANRVTEIQATIPESAWRHVASPQNPADCASRGLLPNEIIQHSLWWAGPTWLKDPPGAWPSGEIQVTQDDDLPEQRIMTLLTVASDPNWMLSKFSKLTTLLRVTCQCLRFARRCKGDRISEKFITCSEYQAALKIWIRRTQDATLSKEFDLLNKGSPLAKPLQRLQPFIDPDLIIRVGGRIRNADINFAHKHPVLLPKAHPFTILLIDHFHKQFCHPSPHTLQTIIQRKYWILSARNEIRKYTTRCMTCFRDRPRTIQPPMGNLPDKRVNLKKPFDVTGVDYGGPFAVTARRGRGCKSTKAYLVLFVCFATKAIHLELASDLTTPTFIAAMRRFIARRGHCSHFYSDGGTNFVGTKRYLNEVYQFVSSSTYNDAVGSALTTEDCSWHINVASAPHFGGLHEAGIKSVKTHLRKVVGTQTLTYEEMITVLCQIEAVLNSRPLCPLSSDPEDLNVLTPAHFLQLSPSAVVPCRDENVNTSHVTRWRLVQQVFHSFRRRWMNEYLSTLQIRTKWLISGAPSILLIGDLVIIKDDNAPPWKWRLARVVKLYNGDDGVARVADVRTASGIFKRPLVKLCKLPNAS